MIDGLALFEGGGLHAGNCVVQCTRRTLGALVLGALSGSMIPARGETLAAAEPEAPDRLPRRRVNVLDTEISYIDVGQGDPVVFLHGNPTWSYQWRHIIPWLSPHRRCLAPDLVGMGWSGKSPGKAYRFVDHVRYMDAWFEALQLTNNVTLVLHDWGAAIGFYRARRHPGQIKAIAYYEAVAHTRRWEDFREGRDRQFRALRSPEGERLVLDENMFVEVVLPSGILRKLSDEEMEAYRAPYRDRERRLPTLMWPRELPIEGTPEDVVAIVEENARWLAASTALPKLFINGDPGAIQSGRARELVRAFPNQRESRSRACITCRRTPPTRSARRCGASSRPQYLSNRKCPASSKRLRFVPQADVSAASPGATEQATLTQSEIRVDAVTAVNSVDRAGLIERANEAIVDQALKSNIEDAPIVCSHDPLHSLQCVEPRIGLPPKFTQVLRRGRGLCDVECALEGSHDLGPVLLCESKRERLDEGGCYFLDHISIGRHEFRSRDQNAIVAGDICGVVPQKHRKSSAFELTALCGGSESAIDLTQLERTEDLRGTSHRHQRDVVALWVEAQLLQRKDR
jgi:haloalkane dehalogenase